MNYLGTANAAGLLPAMDTDDADLRILKVPVCRYSVKNQAELAALPEPGAHPGTTAEPEAQEEPGDQSRPEAHPEAAALAEATPPPEPAGQPQSSAV